MVGIGRHGKNTFDVPCISQNQGNPWQAGCEDESCYRTAAYQRESYRAGTSEAAADHGIGRTRGNQVEDLQLSWGQLRDSFGCESVRRWAEPSLVTASLTTATPPMASSTSIPSDSLSS
jgi:hypothetical protein